MPTYTTATATPDLSCSWDLHHSSRQRQILNPLTKARDQTCVLTDTSQIRNPLSYNGDSQAVLSSVTSDSTADTPGILGHQQRLGLHATQACVAQLRRLDEMFSPFCR